MTLIFHILISRFYCTNVKQIRQLSRLSARGMPLSPSFGLCHLLLSTPLSSAFSSLSGSREETPTSASAPGATDNGASTSTLAGDRESPKSFQYIFAIDWDRIHFNGRQLPRIRYCQPHKRVL